MKGNSFKDGEIQCMIRRLAAPTLNSLGEFISSFAHCTELRVFVDLPRHHDPRQDCTVSING